MIHFDISNLKNELLNLEKQTTDVNFWSDSKNSSKILKRVNEIKNKVEQYRKIENEILNYIELNDLLKQEKDIELEKELENGVYDLEKQIEKLEISTLLSGK